MRHENETNGGELGRSYFDLRQWLVAVGTLAALGAGGLLALGVTYWLITRL